MLSNIALKLFETIKCQRLQISNRWFVTWSYHRARHLVAQNCGENEPVALRKLFYLRLLTF